MNLLVCFTVTLFLFAPFSNAVEDTDLSSQDASDIENFDAAEENVDLTGLPIYFSIDPDITEITLINENSFAVNLDIVALDQSGFEIARWPLRDFSAPDGMTLKFADIFGVMTAGQIISVKVIADEPIRIINTAQDESQDLELNIWQSSNATLARDITVPLNVPFSSQRNPSWGCNQLGICASPTTGTSDTCYTSLSPDVKTTKQYTTISNYGCFLASKTMVFNYFRPGYYDPGSLNSCLTAFGGYDYGCSMKFNNTCAPITTAIVVRRIYSSSNSSLATLSPLIDQYLGMGYPILAEVRYNTSESCATKGSQHMVVIVAKNGNTYTIKDPWDGTEISRTLKNGAITGGAYKLCRIHVYEGTVPTVVPTNHVPVAEAAVSKSLTGPYYGYNTPLTVTKGKSVSLYFFANKDVNGDGIASVDPDGWTDSVNGVSSGGTAKWNTDLNQGSPTFEKVISNPSSAGAANIGPYTYTFNDAPGTYEYQMLRITDRQGAKSIVSKIRITVVAAPVTYSMSGTIHSGSNSGIGLSGATVSIAGKTATTSSTGTFSITGIFAGTYSFSVLKTGYNTYTNSAYYVGSNQTGLNFYLTQPTNHAPIAEAAVSKSSTGGPYYGYTTPLTVTKGQSVSLYFFADKDVNGDGKASLDPDGWTDSVNGVSSGGNCKWNTDLNQGTPTFEKVITNPAAAGNCNIGPYTYTFNDALGTYEYQMLKITDRKGAQSNVSKIRITVVAASVTYSMSGTIHIGSNSGSVLSGATVSIAGKTATTSSTGTFSIAGISTGTYSFSVSKTGYNTYTNPAYYVGSNQSGLNFYLTTALTCPSGNGLYCGSSALGQNTNYLYQCTNGTYTLSQQCSNGCQQNAPGTNDSCKTASVPGSISVSPSSGSWTSSPHNLTVSSSGATTIYFTMVNTYDGSTPSTPSDPSPSSKSGSFSGPSGTFQLYASSGQYKKTKIKFVGCNTAGCGSVSGSYSYTTDLRTTTQCPSGNGYYCGSSSLGQNSNYLYQCSSGIYTLKTQCTNGCQVNPPGTNDACR